MVRDLTKGRPANVILLFAFPIILGNVFQQIYSVVDSIIVGRYVSYQALAGVGITNGLTFFIFGFVIGITSGLGIMTAQFFGAKNFNQYIGNWDVCNVTNMESMFNSAHKFN